MDFGSMMNEERSRECDHTRRQFITFEQWEEAARELLDPRAFSYAASGAGEGATIEANRESFKLW